MSFLWRCSLINRRRTGSGWREEEDVLISEQVEQLTSVLVHKLLNSLTNAAGVFCTRLDVQFVQLGSENLLSCCQIQLKIKLSMWVFRGLKSKSKIKHLSALFGFSTFLLSAAVSVYSCLTCIVLVSSSATKYFWNKTGSFWSSEAVALLPWCKVRREIYRINPACR